MTSRDVTFTTTGRPTGMTTSFAVRKRFDGSVSLYSSCHHHCRPVTLMVTASAIRGAAVAPPTETLATSHTPRMATVATDAATTQRVMTTSDDGRMLRLRTAITRTTMTAANTTAVMKNISHHNHSMAAACGPAAS